jgi:putative transcriptional regulator
MKNEVRALRSARGLSQGELAAVLGVSRQTVNAIETERYTPSLPLALSLARYFGSTVERIFDAGEGAAPASRRGDDPAAGAD